jgi:excisionase family DNA binding protein
MPTRQQAKVNAISVSQAAEFLGVSGGMIHSWVDSGKLQGFRTPNGSNRSRLGNRTIFPKHLMQFMETHGIPVPPSLRKMVEEDEAFYRRLRRMT